MFKAFVQYPHAGRLVSPAQTAADGLNLLGYEVVWFKSFEEINVTRDTLVVGFIDTYRNAIASLGIIPPENIDIPVELEPFTGRRIWETTLAYARNESHWPVFIKPLKHHKEFPGKIINRFRDLLTSSTLPQDFPVLASEVVKFVSEYRCFMWKHEIMSVRHYKGNPLVFPDPKRIQTMADAWITAPVACCIDVGVIDSGETLLVEVNDGHSMGDYGLRSLVYARMLEARWCELTGASPIP